MYKKIRDQDVGKKGIMENHADEKLQAKKSDIAECDKVLYKKVVKLLGYGNFTVHHIKYTHIN